MPQGDQLDVLVWLVVMLEKKPTDAAYLGSSMSSGCSAHSGDRYREGTYRGSMHVKVLCISK
jgi:hypothetical protein